jgi:hypothetical protein
MSSVIHLLQQIGENANLMQASNDQLATFVEPANLGDQLQSALIAGDHAQLVNLLGARTHVVCGLAAPDQDDEQKDNDKEEDKDNPADGNKVRAIKLAA